MPDSEQILNAIVERIEAIARPERVILFGSRARGKARSDSDVDLLVIAESDEPRYRRSAPLYAALATAQSKQMSLYTPSEVAEWSAVPQAFVTTAFREGHILYEETIRSHR
jgi:predicted nucleotidyltransferase